MYKVQPNLMELKLNKNSVQCARGGDLFVEIPRKNACVSETNFRMVDDISTCYCSAFSTRNCRQKSPRWWFREMCFRWYGYLDDFRRCCCCCSSFSSFTRTDAQHIVSYRNFLSVALSVVCSVYEHVSYISINRGIQYVDNFIGWLVGRPFNEFPWVKYQTSELMYGLEHKCRPILFMSS